MIAPNLSHYDRRVLRQLLDEQLDAGQTALIENHLDRCESCRKILESIAGEQSWWDETVGVLSDNPSCAVSRSTDTETDAETLHASIDWIRPLLSASDSNDALGQLGGYSVEHVIGQGGMGVVLRGFDPELNRPVAIKVLSPHLAGVGAARARFLREAQAAAAIVHPSIVPIYSVVTNERLPYIVMPCISGGNLQQRIDREGPIELAEVLRIGLQISEGLLAAHRNGVVHRDIKPANILVEQGNGRVLISDFGLARALDDATLTVSGMIAGTPQYMSPEQARGEYIDARSDLFSLGSLLYALATGRPPFRAESPLAVLKKITENEPRHVHEINERFPLWFDTLLQHFMQKSTSLRIETAEAAAELLRAALAHVRQPSTHPLPAQLRRRRPRSSGSRFVMAGGVAILLAALTSTGGYLGLRQSSDRPTASDSDPQPTASPISTATPDVTHVTSAPAASESDELTWFENQIPQELAGIEQTLESIAASLDASENLFKLPSSAVTE